MSPFEIGSKVRVNEGLLEGQTGIVVDSREHVTLVKVDDVAFGGGDLAFYTETLVSGDEPHPALEKMQSLYPDFLKAPKSDNYRFRLTTYVHGVFYLSVPLDARMLKRALQTPPAGLERLEFMLKKDDPSRGLSWKMLWSDS